MHGIYIRGDLCGRRLDGCMYVQAKLQQLGTRGGCGGARAAAQLGTQKHSLPTTQQCQPDAFMYLVAFVVIVILSSTHVGHPSFIMEWLSKFSLTAIDYFFSKI